MPRLPAPEDYGISSPRPSRGVTEISPVQVRPDLATGKAMQDIGLLMQQEAEKLDETVALDALNQLQNKQLDLTYGDNGFTKVQGKGVIDRKITAEYPTQLQTEMDRLAGTINSTAAKQRFQAQANGVLRGFKASVYTHAAKETETYQVQTDNAQIETARTMAFNGDLKGAEAYASQALARVIARQGLEGEAATEAARKAMGSVYSAYIESLAKVSPAQAANLLTETRDLMTAEQVKHLDHFVGAKNDYATGLALADEVKAKGLQGEAAYDYVLKGAKGNEQVAAKAMAVIDKKRAEAQAEEHGQVGLLVQAFNKLPPTAASKAQIEASDLYNAAGTTPSARNAATAQMQARIDHVKAQGRADFLFNEQRKELAMLRSPEAQQVVDAFAADPTTLLAYTPAQLTAMLPPVIGFTRADVLIKLREEQNRAALAFTVPKEEAMRYLPEKLQKAANDHEKAQQQEYLRLQNLALMEWKANNPGRVPNEAEVQNVMRAGGAEWVRLNPSRFEFNNQTYPGYDRPTDRITIPKAFDDSMRERLGKEYDTYDAAGKQRLYTRYLEDLSRKKK